MEGVSRQTLLGLLPLRSAHLFDFSLAEVSAGEVSLHAFRSGFLSVWCRHHCHDFPALRAVGKPIDSCLGGLTSSHLDYDS